MRMRNRIYGFRRHSSRTWSMVRAQVLEMRKTVKAHCDKIQNPGGKNEIVQELRDMTVSEITKLFKFLFDIITEDNYNRLSPLLDTYIEILEEKDPMPPITPVEEALAQFWKRAYEEGLVESPIPPSQAQDDPPSA